MTKNLKLSIIKEDKKGNIINLEEDFEFEKSSSDDGCE